MCYQVTPQKTLVFNFQVFLNFKPFHEKIRTLANGHHQEKIRNCLIFSRNGFKSRKNSEIKTSSVKEIQELNVRDCYYQEVIDNKWTEQKSGGTGGTELPWEPGGLVEWDQTWGVESRQNWRFTFTSGVSRSSCFRVIHGLYSFGFIAPHTLCRLTEFFNWTKSLSGMESTVGSLFWSNKRVSTQLLRRSCIPPA